MSKSEGYKARYKARGSGRDRAEAMAAAGNGSISASVAVPAQIRSSLRNVDALKPTVDLDAARSSLDSAMKTARSDRDIAETRRQIYGRQPTRDNAEWRDEANRDEQKSKARLQEAEATYNTAVAQAKRYNRAIDANTRQLAQLKMKVNRNKRVAAGYVSGSGLASPRDQSAVLTNSLRASGAQFDKARRVDPAIAKLKAKRVKIGPKPTGGRAPIRYYDTRSRQRSDREFGTAGRRPGAMSSRAIRNRGSATAQARRERRGF